MIRIVSWNIAKRWEPWRELAEMARRGEVDVALLQEAGNPPGDLVNAIEFEDDVLWSRHLYDRWPLVVRLSDRVEVEGFRQVVVRRRRLTPRNRSESTCYHADRRPICTLNNTCRPTGYTTLVGAQMRYAVHDRNGWPLAMLGFSAAAKNSHRVKVSSAGRRRSARRTSPPS